MAPACRPQALVEEIGEACSALAVKPPLSMSITKGSAQLYQSLILTVAQPDLAIPETPSLKVGVLFFTPVEMKGALIVSSWLI